MSRFQTMVAAVSAIVMLTSGVASIAHAQQVGPPGSMIYAHDETYRTVATPTDLPPPREV